MRLHPWNELIKVLSVLLHMSNYGHFNMDYHGNKINFPKDHFL
jgi:hypothetical protein